MFIFYNVSFKNIRLSLKCIVEYNGSGQLEKQRMVKISQKHFPQGKLIMLMSICLLNNDYRKNIDIKRIFLNIMH